jgi:hypothetical protein
MYVYLLPTSPFFSIFAIIMAKTTRASKKSKKTTTVQHAEKPALSLFERLGALRKSLLYATCPKQKLLFLAEWRFLEMETLVWQLDDGSITFRELDDKNKGRYLIASKSAYDLRKLLAQHLGNAKIFSIPPPGNTQSLHVKVLPLNLRLIAQLLTDLETNEVEMPSLGVILEWSRLVTTLLRALDPIIVCRRRLLISQYGDDKPGRDDSFFSGAVMLHTFDFEEKKTPAQVLGQLLSRLPDDVVPDDFDVKRVERYLNDRWLDALFSDDAIVYNPDDPNM